MDAPRADPLGDSALTLTFGETVDAATSARVHAAAQAVRAAGIAAVRDVVPAYAALSVFYDPLHTDYADIVAQVLALSVDGGSVASLDAGPLVEIPVRYDGPDLEDVARATGLSPREVMDLHAATEYRVYLLGFAPGFAYLGDLDPALHLPRRPSPRTRVPAGSVAIAGAQTAVYPLATPGGWHLLGSTAAAMWDVRRDPPALLAVGDRVRFVRG
ncbi:MAG: allophanate hydrolase [Gemmatimonadetes bacterium]|nr:allophanate hydrolase [Gemmatimonadota bacterium]